MITKITLAVAIALSVLISFAYAENATEKKAIRDEKKAIQDVTRAADAWSWAWGDFCRRNIFGQNVYEWELSPGPDAVNKKPWLDYCKGYFDAMFDLAQVFQLVCLPEGTRKFQIQGSVIAAYGKASEEQKRVPPPQFAIKAWMDAFPCKSK